MEAIKLHMKVESDTLKIPGLSRFIGKRVEIILLEDASAARQKDQYSKLKKLKGKIHFDEDAVALLREKSKL
ncbi:MAG: hypothetical protein A2176_09885 [Spirochaetes bacterium RBG_13_51_14]|nr:MAG: hypothetical protein A2176_09885 [Spirochaetes bacterium RBG_13_51_14]